MNKFENTQSPEKKDPSIRLNEVYERCDVNMLQLCKKLESMRDSDFDISKMPLQDISDIQQVFPKGKSWKLDKVGMENLTDYPTLNNNGDDDYAPEARNPLRSGDDKNYIKFAGNKVKIKKTF